MQVSNNQNKYFNIMAFPSGPICNLACDYCYYLEKSELYKTASDFRMSEELLEEYIKQYIDSQPGPQIYFGWQGGEPTLRGLDFFKKALKLQKKYLPEGWQLQNSLQTNAVLIDDQWAEFLSDNNFLVGVSLDGPADLHNKYRKDKSGEGSYQKVMAGIKKLKEYQVEYNILAVVNEATAKKPKEVYQFFKELEADFIQFIPIVERDADGKLISRSVEPLEYGQFLIKVFNQWLKNDIGDIFVQIFEESLRAWLGMEPNLCIFSKRCGSAAVMEHNGDLYSCDHFVLPEYKLGNIKDEKIIDLMNSKQQLQFGNAKKEELSEQCRNCDYLFVCNGGCPKNRIVEIEDGEKINYLCEGYQLFFSYIDPFMKKLAEMVRARKTPKAMQQEMIKIYQKKWDVGRNDSCPCGSGRKYKKCCS